MANKKNPHTHKPAPNKRTPAQKMASAVAILLAVLMALSILVSLIPVSSAATPQETIDKLKQQLAALDKKKDKLDAELSEISTDIKTINKQITALDEQIVLYEEELELNGYLLATMEELVAEKQAELEVTTAKAEAQYEKLKSRLRVMVERGSNTYLSVLLSADNFADFLAKYSIVSDISTYDKKIYNDLKETRELMAKQQAELTAVRDEQKNYNAAVEILKAQLEAQKEYRTNVLVSLKNNQSTAKAAYAQISREEDELSEAIKKAVAELAKTTEYQEGAFQWPLPLTKDNLVVTCKFGMRTHPITGVYKLHTGIDLRAYTGTKVYAAKAGTVITSAKSTAYGNYIVINHGGGEATLYAHLNKRMVSVGAQVKAGQQIGQSGNTGYSTAPHLHFEIIVDGEYTNPLDHYPNTPYTIK